VVSVSCPSGGAIEIAGDIARDLQGLLNRASERGVGLCGTGWRDPSEQVALRRQNCGRSDWAIYEAPSSACAPPTAPPGSSMHERGLAIDFTYAGGGAIGCGSEAYSYLDDNAADFGFYNLPGECWHWSTNGQ
jgi:LAS superfamily LD-carboxypeptidase LdcB